MAGPLIVTAELGEADFACFDALRKKHFPPERNHLSAHLTMFHALPPSVEAEARAMLKRLAGACRPPAAVSGVLDLGRGVAFKVESASLSAMREEIAEHFHGCLTAQDAGGWRPHITVQNKVDRSVAVSLRRAVEATFQPRDLTIRGLELHRYLGGAWEALGRWRFRA